MTTTKVILILLILAITPIALLMDPSFFWENGPIEMAQNFVLGLATLVMLYWTIKEKAHKGLWFTGSLLFFIAFLRELSWGRVFYVMGMDADGPIIAEKFQVWFGPYINSFVGILLVLLLVSIILNRKTIAHVLKLLLADKSSLVYAFFMVVCLVAAVALFDRDVIKIISPWHQGFEELSELTSYWAALTMAVRIHYLELKK